MLQAKKKSQIIRSYIDDILPYLEYTNVDGLKFKGHLRIGSTKYLKKEKLQTYVGYSSSDESHLELDFTDSSIKDVYKGLTIINKSILIS